MEAGPKGEKQPLGRDVVMALVALALAVFVVANDFTALSVALPNMEGDLDSRFPQLLDQLEQLGRDAFVAGVHTALRVDAVLALAGFLVTLFFVGGRLRDRRRQRAAVSAG